jgi:putative transposase
MMYPLVLELAATDALLRVPVTVTCRVLGFSTKAFYKWRADPVCARDLDDAYLTNAAVDLHTDDPEFGYRLIADDLKAAGHLVSENRIWRLCSAQRLWSVHSKKRGLNRKPGPPVHDDLLQRDFTAIAADVVWLTDITEHPTNEGKLYLCAVKDVFSNRIVGYSIDSRMKSSLAVAALANAVAQRTPHATIVHSDRGRPVPLPQVRPCPQGRRPAGLDGTRRCLRRQRRHGVVLRAPAEERPQPPTDLDHP